MIGSVDVMITADLIEMPIVDLSAAPALSPTVAVPFTMLRRKSITGYCFELR